MKFWDYGRLDTVKVNDWYWKECITFGNYTWQTWTDWERIRQTSRSWRRIGLPYLYGTRHEGEGDRRDPERKDQPEAACGYPGWKEYGYAFLHVRRCLRGRLLCQRQPRAAAGENPQDPWCPWIKDRSGGWSQKGAAHSVRIYRRSALSRAALCTSRRDQRGRSCKTC